MLWSSMSTNGYATGMAIHDGTTDLLSGWKLLPYTIPCQADAGHAMLFNWRGQLFLSLHSPNFPFGEERPLFVPVVWDNEILNFETEKK